MKSMGTSLKNISPRLMGYIAGATLLLSVVSSFVDEAEYLLESFTNELGGIMGEYIGESPVGADDVISLIIGTAVSLITAAGLLKCNHKIILAGLAASFLSVGYYVFELFTASHPDYVSIALNISNMVMFVLVAFSILIFSKALSAVTVIITAILKLGLPVYMFIITVSGYPFEFSFESFTNLLSVISNLGFDTAVSYVLMSLFVYVLVTYEGEEPYDENAEQCSYYMSMSKHIFLAVVFNIIWYYIWVYRTTKALNEIDTDGKKYNPTAEALLNLIPFYPFYWTYRQLSRLEKALVQSGVKEEGMGIVGIILRVIESLMSVSVYTQYKINEYCTVNAGKLRKKEKYNDYYDENEGITIDYPTDTTEKKTTEMFLEESPWNEYESE